MIPHRVQLALLLSFVCHGVFIITARYRLSYDAYTHMLLADHYARNWFSIWDNRWYAGFQMISYPPLAHQLVALFIPFIGFDAAFALILWIIMTFYPLGIYAFARIFTGIVASSYAALASAVLFPIYFSAYIFGQLPFLTSTLLALFGAVSVSHYLRFPTPNNIALAVSLTATTAAAHHATLLFLPFLITAITLPLLNKQNWQPLILRLILYGTLAILAVLLVIWPFWIWGLGQTMQTPIDHLSRHNFFLDPFAQIFFFWPLYGPLVMVIPFLFFKWPKRFLGLSIAFAVLFLLGLGGTTLLPSMLFGNFWEWLTYDRFAFWAALLLTPFLGSLLILIRNKFPIRMEFQTRYLWRRRILLLTFSIFAITSIGIWIIPYFYSIQPAPIDMKPIVRFLNSGDRSKWRYLTFGFGQQFAYLNLLASATTIDGSYHTARLLPELRDSGIAEIDTALWTPEGISAIDPILKKAGEYGVRWGFVNRREYDPELMRYGWRYLWTLSNGINVWENPKAAMPVSTSHTSDQPAASYSWGILPLLSLIITLFLGFNFIRHGRMDIVRNET